jgi:hypothetical protein
VHHRSLPARLHPCRRRHNRARLGGTWVGGALARGPAGYDLWACSSSGWLKQPSTLATRTSSGDSSTGRGPGSGCDRRIHVARVHRPGSSRSKHIRHQPRGAITPLRHSRLTFLPWSLRCRDGNRTRGTADCGPACADAASWSSAVVLDSCHPSGRCRRVNAREATACGLALTRRTRPSNRATRRTALLDRSLHRLQRPRRSAAGQPVR